MWPADRIVRARELCSIDCSNKRKNFYNVRLDCRERTEISQQR